MKPNNDSKSAAGGISLLSPSVVVELREFWGLLSLFFKTQLPPLPSFVTDNEVKEFCEGLFDPGKPHPLREWAESAPDRLRFGVQHSLFLFRKRIPASGDPSVKADMFLKHISTPSPATDPEFLAFIEQEIPKLFKPGWDHAYVGNVSRLTLPSSSCIEASRSDGGARSQAALSFVTDAALGLADPPLDRRAKVGIVEDGCKYRVITSGSVNQSILAPLHHTIYDHLSSKNWLLRGDAKSSRFEDFTAVPGEVFVSGDYEAATDNLPLDVYQALLRAVGRTSTHVPGSVWDWAEWTSVHDVYVPGGRQVVTQRRGQLMGSFLSFPFLCLTNYLAFKFAVRRHVPLRINGDDIAFRATKDEVARWQSLVRGCGLTLSKGKSWVHERYFTLNSTLFRAGVKRCFDVPFVRANCLLARPSTLAGLKGQWKDLASRSANGTRLDGLRVRFLHKNAGLIDSSRRSLSRGMGLHVPPRVLRMAGLFAREQFYLSFPDELPIPPLVPYTRYENLPAGCQRVAVRELDRKSRRVARDFERDIFFPSVRTLARVSTAVFGYRDYWSRVRQGTWGYYRHRRPPGLLRCWQRFCNVLGVQPRNRAIPAPTVEEMVWIPKEGEWEKRGCGQPLEVEPQV